MFHSYLQVCTSLGEDFWGSESGQHTSNGCNRLMFRSMAGKGEAEAHSIDHWLAVGQKLTAEKHLAEDVKKVREGVQERGRAAGFRF